MGIFKKKSAAEKARKQDIKAAKKEARSAKKDVRKDARAEKKDARKESRTEKKDARQEKRASKKDARQDKKAAIKRIRQSDLKGKEKKAAKKDVRADKKDAVKVARQNKKDEVKAANQEKRADVREANQQKRVEIKDIREQKRRKLQALRVPKALDRRWNSYLRFQEIQALEIYKPKTLAHLKSICRIATEEGLKVRAIGSGHSFSECGITDDLFVETGQMNDMLPMSEVRKRKIKAGRRRDLAEFQVGRTIIDLSRELEKTNHALVNQGTYDGQTFWGAVSTSTHGSGLSRGPFPAMVASLVLVGEGGRTYRIEPADGITNPDGWRERGVDELIQDNDVFQSVVCSFGSMGIVYSAVIYLRDFYWLDEWTFVSTWDTFKNSFSDTNELVQFIGRWDTISLLVSPVKAKKGKKDGVSFTGEHPCSFALRLETAERRKIGGRFFDSVAKLFEDVGVISGNAPAEGNPRRPKFTDLKRDDTWIANFSTKQGGKRGWSGEKFTAADLGDIPIKRRNKCYRIFPKGGKLFGGYGIELAFPIRHTFEMMDRIIELAEQNVGDGLFHTAPVAVRFVKPSMAYASPQYARHRADGTPDPNDPWSAGTVMFEVLMAKGTEDGATALALIEEAMLHENSVRVHWGLSMDRVSDDNMPFAERFPMWSRFVQTFRRFNTNGTFSNSLTDRIGLS